MANQEQLILLQQGSEAWNKWVEDNPGVQIDFVAADLRALDLSGYYLEGANLSRANLSGVDVSESNLIRANLSASILRDADLHGTHFRHANIVEADFSGANLQHTVFFRGFLDQATFAGADLTSAELVSAEFLRINFREANLTKSNFHYAQLSYPDFTGANLRESKFQDALLYKAELSQAVLTGADFIGTNFLETDLKQCDLSGTKMYRTVLANMDLSDAKGLEEVDHWGPSTIGVDTISKSRGQIPERFLQGCGLSDWEIEAARLYTPGLSNHEIDESLYKIHDLRAGQAVQVSPLFISYSHKDSAFVDTLEQHLNRKGVRFWRDVHGLTSGRIETQIDRAIRQHPTLLVILSKHSFQSDWVEHEVRMARGLEKEKGWDVLCPIALDDSWTDSRWPKRMMEQIMEYNILDFSDWQNEVTFKHTFNKLIDGLELFYRG